MSYVIFSIDFEKNPLRMNVFRNYLPGLDCAGSFIPIIGKYNGEMEHAFICDLVDFNEHIRGTVFIAGQESILHVASGNKMEAVLEFLADGRREALGSMHQVSEEEAMQHDSWMYRPDLDMWWVARPGNPDILPPPTGWPAARLSEPTQLAAE